MNKDAKRTGVYGGSGSGKSAHVKKMIRARRSKGRILVFDPLDEYSALPGFERVVHTPNERELQKALSKQSFRIAYVPEPMREAERLHRVSMCLMRRQMAYKIGKATTKALLIVEEMNSSFPVNNLKSELYGFPEICSRGRHYGIEVVGVSQRLAEINTRFRGNTDVAYFFPPGNNPRDISAAREILGSAANDLGKLQTHNFIKIERGNVTKGKNKIT